MYLGAQLYAFEFKSVDDAASPFDVILDHLDPSLIQFCLDTGWLHIVDCRA